MWICTPSPNIHVHAVRRYYTVLLGADDTATLHDLLVTVQSLPTQPTLLESHLVQMRRCGAYVERKCGRDTDEHISAYVYASRAVLFAHYAHSSYTL